VANRMQPAVQAGYWRTMPLFHELDRDSYLRGIPTRSVTPRDARASSRRLVSSAMVAEAKEQIVSSPLIRRFVGKRRAGAGVSSGRSGQRSRCDRKRRSRCQARFRNDMVDWRALAMTAPPIPDVVSEIP